MSNLRLSDTTSTLIFSKKKESQNPTASLEQFNKGGSNLLYFSLLGKKVIKSKITERGVIFPKIDPKDSKYRESNRGPKMNP